MNHRRYKAVTRLEEKLSSYISRQRQAQHGTIEFIQKEASAVLLNLAAICLYGEPKIEEPLTAAWERCRQSAAWQEGREKYGGFDEYGREGFTPFDDLGTEQISEYFHRYFLPDLPGRDETGKLTIIFKSAPPWLLWFTHADVRAIFLGISIPDLTEIRRFRRENITLYNLPTGPFKCDPWPNGVSDQFTAKKSQNVDDLFEDMTPRQRNRTRRIYETYGLAKLRIGGDR